MILCSIAFIDLYKLMKEKSKMIFLSFIFVFSIFGPLKNILIGVTQKFND